MRFLKVFSVILAIVLLCGCGAAGPVNDITVTTAPVAQITQAIVNGTDLSVHQLITDDISCLHDYSLSVGQMEALASSRTVIISGNGLESSMSDALAAAYQVVDCSVGASCDDAHYWLDPQEAARITDVICTQLSSTYAAYAPLFRRNADLYKEQLTQLQAYGEEQLADLSCRELITFHDGFSCLAKAFDLQIAAAIEEESGSEASAQTLAEIIALVEQRQIPAVFTEKNGSDAAASVIAAETGVKVYSLDMALSGDYLQAMYHNIDTLKEALS